MDPLYWNVANLPLLATVVRTSITPRNSTVLPAGSLNSSDISISSTEIKVPVCAAERMPPVSKKITLENRIIILCILDPRNFRNVQLTNEAS